MIFRRNKHDKRSVAIGLDLGTQQIKAVALRREDTAIKLAGYDVRPVSVPFGKNGATQHFVGELEKALAKLPVHDRLARATISSPSAILCDAELPRIPITEVRDALRLPTNATKYLRRDVTGYYIDATELANGATEDEQKRSPTMRVLVAGASKEEVLWYQEILSSAKVKVETIELSALAGVNALCLGRPDLVEKDVLLLDIGARTTTINFVRHGIPVMTRIMQFGGEQINEFIAEILTLQPAAAEEEKIKMSDAVQPLVRQSLLPLAREIRSSIDFFERQQDCHLTSAFAGGGTACSFSILEFLSEEVGIQIAPWNATEGIDISGLGTESEKLAAVAPSLTAAMGVALAQF